MKKPVLQTALSLVLSLLLGACTAPRSFIEMGHPEAAKNGRINPLAAPLLSDALALNYSDAAVSLLRSKYQGARISRQSTELTQVGLAAATGASAAFGYSARTIAWLGVGSVLAPELQRIFDAKGRSQAYQDAVRLIEEAQVEYLSFNQDPSSDYLTQNGVTLLQRVTATIHLVEKTLIGQLPTVEDMNKATEPMSTRGAVRTKAGTTPQNNIPANPLALRLPKKAPTEERNIMPPVLSAGKLTPAGERILEALGNQVAAMRASNNGKRASSILAKRAIQSTDAEAVEVLALELAMIQTDAQARLWKTAFNDAASVKTGPSLGPKEGTVERETVPPPPPGGLPALEKTPGAERPAVPPRAPGNK